MLALLSNKSQEGKRMSDQTEQTVRMTVQARRPASEDSISDSDRPVDSLARGAATQAEREPVKRALDTGARGWRWLVVSVLLALLPCYVCAAGSSGVTSAPSRLTTQTRSYRPAEYWTWVCE